jgi:beta-lactamase regulating signal transducer with metallopeptidase domain
MMPTINGVILAISSSLAASIVAKVTLTTALGLMAARLARGNRAAVRHALLAAIFGVMLLLPIGSIFMPPLPVGLTTVARSYPVLPLFKMAVAADPSAMAAGGARTSVTPAVPQASFNFLLAGWASGTALFLLPVAVGLWQIRSLRRSGLPWRHGQAAAKALALDAGIHRRVDVLLHEALPGPMTCGIAHPAIILPRDAEYWTQEDLNRALIHELEHVRRGDSMTRCCARIACALYWFHPLVWIAWRRLVLEAERSCDDAVLGGSEATAYADQLVGLAKRLSASKRSPAVAMANRIDLATRVGAVLDSRQRRGRAGTLSVALACAVALAIIVLIFPLTVVAAPQAPAAAGAAAQIERVVHGPILPAKEPLLLAQAGGPAPAPASPRQVQATSNKIEAVEIRGARRIPEDTLKALLTIRPGDSYDAKAVERDAVKLRNTGRFSDVTVKTDTGDHGDVVVRFTVAERTILRDPSRPSAPSGETNSPEGLASILSKFRGR